MIPTRSAGLLIDTVVCLTLAKWETVSGRFGGYLMKRLSKLPMGRVGAAPVAREASCSHACSAAQRLPVASAKAWVREQLQLCYSPTALAARPYRDERPPLPPRDVSAWRRRLAGRRGPDRRLVVRHRGRILALRSEQIAYEAIDAAPSFPLRSACHRRCIRQAPSPLRPQSTLEAHAPEIVNAA